MIIAFVFAIVLVAITKGTGIDLSDDLKIIQTACLLYRNCILSTENENKRCITNENPYNDMYKRQRQGPIMADHDSKTSVINSIYDMKIAQCAYDSMLAKAPQLAIGFNAATNSSNVCIFLIRRPNFRASVIAAKPSSRSSCLVEIAKRRTMCNELGLCCPTIKECAEQQSAMKNSEISIVDSQFAEHYRNMKIAANASTV